MEENYFEFSGKTTAEALRKAEHNLGVPLSQMQVEVVRAGSSGFLGLWRGKPALLRVRLAARALADDVAALVHQLNDSAAPAPSLEQPQTGAADQAEAGALDFDPEEEAGADGPALNPELAAEAAALAGRLLAVLDKQARAEVSLRGSRLELNLISQDPGLLIGRRGQTLDALQYLLTRILSHKCGHPVRLLADVENYRQRRAEELNQAALRQADKARKSGKTASLGPLTSRERRIVHNALKNQPGIATSSSGRGELKRVFISCRPDQS